MNLQTAIYNKILEPKYHRVYGLLEELSRTKVERFKREYKQDATRLLSEIIIIKEKYNIPFEEDIVLFEKYKK